MGIGQVLQTAVTNIYIPPFSPGQLANLELWLREDSIVESLGVMSAWNDKSTNARNCTVNGTVNYNAADSDFGGRACAVGAGGEVQSPSFSLPVPYTVILVCTGFTGGSGYFWTRSDANDYLFHTSPTMRSVRSGGTTEFIDNNSTWGNFGSPAKSVATEVNTTTAGSALLLNNVAESLTDLVDGATTEANSNPFVLFNNPSTSSGGSTLKVSEVIVCSRKLTGTELANVFAYQQARYGI